MKLLLTRALEDSAATKKELERQGYEVFCLPLIAIYPASDGGARLKRAAKEIKKYDWLILTSRNAERALKHYIKKLPKKLKIAAVGHEGVAGLIEFFKNKNVRGKRFLYPRSQIGREELHRFLKKRGAIVDLVEAYQTKPSSVTAKKIETVLKKGVEVVLFFSPSAVKSFFGKMRGKKKLLKKIAFVPIGPTTAKALARTRM